MNLIPEAEGRTPFYLDPARIWRRLPAAERLSFISALLIGSVTHLFVLSNLLPNHDATVSLYSGNSHLNLGRWSLSFFSAFSWLYEMPVVIGLLSILALALSALLTIRFLELHSPVCIVLVSGFLTAFPAVACTFGYLYTADAYFLAFFLTAAAACLAKGPRWCRLLSVLCLATALGAYQSYVGCTVGLLLFDCILALLSNVPIKDVLKRGVRYILIILASLVLYRVILNLFLWKYGFTLSNYSGMSDAVAASVMDYLRALPSTYRDLFWYLWRPSYLPPPLLLAQRVMFVLAFGCAVYLIFVRHHFRDPLKIILLALGALMMPAALNLICLIGAGNAVPHILTLHPVVYAYVFAVKFFELTAVEAAESRFHKAARNGTALTGLALCTALVWMFFCLSNAVYFSLHQTYENSYAAGVRILSRLESMEGYIPGETPVLLNGYFVSNQYSHIPYTYLGAMRGVEGLGHLSRYSGTTYLNEFCGASVRMASEEQKSAVEASGILEEMPAFPLKGCVQLYNGIAVVKLS